MNGYLEKAVMGLWCLSLINIGACTAEPLSQAKGVESRAQHAWQLLAKAGVDLTVNLELAPCRGFSGSEAPGLEIDIAAKQGSRTQYRIRGYADPEDPEATFHEQALQDGLRAAADGFEYHVTYDIEDASFDDVEISKSSRCKDLFDWNTSEHTDDSRVQGVASVLSTFVVQTLKVAAGLEFDDDQAQIWANPAYMAVENAMVRALRQPVWSGHIANKNDGYPTVEDVEEDIVVAVANLAALFELSRYVLDEKHTNTGALAVAREGGPFTASDLDELYNGYFSGEKGSLKGALSQSGWNFQTYTEQVQGVRACGVGDKIIIPACMIPGALQPGSLLARICGAATQVIEHFCKKHEQRSAASTLSTVTDWRAFVTNVTASCGHRVRRVTDFGQQITIQASNCGDIATALEASGKTLNTCEDIEPNVDALTTANATWTYKKSGTVVAKDNLVPATRSQLQALWLLGWKSLVRSYCVPSPANFGAQTVIDWEVWTSEFARKCNDYTASNTVDGSNWSLKATNCAALGQVIAARGSSGTACTQLEDKTTLKQLLLSNVTLQQSGPVGAALGERDTETLKFLWATAIANTAKNVCKSLEMGRLPPKNRN